MVSYYVLDANGNKTELSAKSNMRGAITEAFAIEAERGAISLFCAVDNSAPRYALTINHSDPRNATNSREDYLSMLLVAYCNDSVRRVTPQEDAYMDACVRAIDSPMGRRF